MSVRILIACDGTRAERPTVSLEQCRGSFPTRATTEHAARAEALAAGWSTRWDPATWPAPSVQQELCPACTRAVADRSPVNGPAS